MTVWSFTLRLNRAPTDDEVDTLFEAGLDDAGVSDATLMVDREAPTLLEAIASAAADVRVVPGLRAVAMDSDGDEVTLADVAQRLGGTRTQESLRLLAAGKRGPGGFPSPTVDTGKVKVYSWIEVSTWLRLALREDVPAIPGDLLLADRTLRLAALAVEFGHHDEVVELLTSQP